jgi:hypothetical protein
MKSLNESVKSSKKVAQVIEKVVESGDEISEITE